MSFPRRFARDQDGSVLVEATVMMPILLLFLLGAIDFLFAFYDWSAATKAVEVGARIAAVSDPVAPELKTITDSATAEGDGVLPFTGASSESFQVTCNDGGTKQCTCLGKLCTGTYSFDQAAMNKIICGRDNLDSTDCTLTPANCHNATGYYFAGMCDIFPLITTANVKIVYTQTGLGFTGRKGGPVPTITVSTQNLPFRYFFLNGLMGFQPISINQALPTALTGEVLCSAAQPPGC
jgi:Flp pilus assembly protein TadG